LQHRIGHTFRQAKLLQRALTHSSLAYEQAADGHFDEVSDNADNEQLEFLGDAVVGLVAADSLYRRYPELREGELTRLRAALVSRQHLGQVASRLDLGSALFLGKGEERSGGRKKSALLANAIEALIGAVYLDAGLESARVFVEQWVVEPYVGELRATIERGGNIGDHKSALQEFLQARKAGQPQYTVKAESGPDHRKRFLVEVRMPAAKVNPAEPGKPRLLARGSGTTKKHAEQEAARRAYQKLIRENARPQTGTETGIEPGSGENPPPDTGVAHSPAVEELVS
jgi:ribonuclease-3